jgi:hypothetical protein
MSIIINGKDYGDVKELRLGLPAEFSAMSSLKTLSDRKKIMNMPVNMIQHGMILLDREKEEYVESIYVTPPDTRTSFYHLHIYKTSGLSLRSNVIKMFHGSQCYNNFIGLYDKDQVLSSNFISGHFFRKPIEDFKEANKKIHPFTIIRNPIDRMISHFMYEVHLYDNAQVNLDSFYEFLHSKQPSIKNLQTKNITSTMDTKLSNIAANSLLEGTHHSATTVSALRNNLQSLGKTNRYMSPHTNENKWQNYIDEFSLIGTVDNRDNFMGNLYSLLIKEGYTGHFGKEQFVNKSENSTSEFKKTLTQDMIDRIYYLNKYDFELYDYLMSRGL